MKSKLIKNVDPRQGRFFCNNEINCISQFGDIIVNNNETEAVNYNVFNRDAENNFECFFLKNLVDNLFEYLSEQNNKEQKLFNKMDQIPRLLEKENNGKENIINDFIFKSNEISNNLNDLKNIAKDNNMKSEILNNILRKKANSINSKYGENIKKIGEGNLESEMLYLNENKNFENIASNKEIINNNNFNSNLPNPENLDNPSNNIDRNLEINNFPTKLDKTIDNKLVLSEDEKSLYLRSVQSPNPFDDLQNNGSLFFNSPSINNFSRNIPKNIDENSEKLNINFDLSRNSSLDYSEIFKNNTKDNVSDKKLNKENNLFFDDSFFEISSNEKK